VRGERKAVAAKKLAALQNISKGDALRTEATDGAELPFPGDPMGRMNNEALPVIGDALGTTMISADNVHSESEIGLAQKSRTPSKDVHDTNVMAHVSELEGVESDSDTQCVLHPLVYSTITEDDDRDRQVREDSSLERYLEDYTVKQNQHR
jgi:hypothetical protein